MTLMGVTGWVTNYLIALSFLPFIEVIGVGGVFSIYAFFCFLCLIIAFTKLHETKKKSLDEIEKLFN